MRRRPQQVLIRTYDVNYCSVSVHGTVAKLGDEDFIRLKGRDLVHPERHFCHDITAGRRDVDIAFAEMEK